MRVQLRKTAARRAPDARARRNRHPRPVAAPGAPPLGETERHRRAGGPEDRALYRCGCGYAFAADVSASVACPHCGSAQSW